MMRPGNRPKIRPPRKSVHGEVLNYEHEWSTLEHAIRQIHTKNASSLSYETLYRIAYKIVLKKQGQKLYEDVTGWEQSWLKEEILAQIQQVLNGNLMSNNRIGVGSSENEVRMSGEKVLRTMNEAFTDHSTCMAMLADVLMYMERVFCNDHRMPSIYSSSMELFKNEILMKPPYGNEDVNTVAHLIDIILNQVRMEREGEIIDKHLIKSCINMLDALYETIEEKEEQKLYLTVFEPSYLENSRQYYADEAERLVKELPAGEYCRYAASRIQQEWDRCYSTLSHQTGNKIVEVLEDVLIRNRLPDLIQSGTGVVRMIETDQVEELGLVYELSERVDPKKHELAKAVGKKIYETGGEINSTAVEAAQARSVPAEGGEEGGEKEKTKPSINQQTAAALKWVEDVLTLKDKYDRIWIRAFKSDPTLQTALTRSISDFINSAAFPRSSEFISLFIDENMKKGIKGKTDDEVDQVLEKAIILLRYIQDKDMFERYYKKHLCRRLLMNKSISNDVEKQMISRMKIELGNNFTSKLEAMFKDMTISEELTSGFKEQLSKNGDTDPSRVDLNINVLTSMTWPLEMIGSNGVEEQGAIAQCIFPSSIERVKQGFEQYYSKKHSGRKLQWLPNMGSADIKTTFSKVPTKEGGVRERKHDINVPTYGMIILMLFNDIGSEKLSFDEIQGRTNISKAELMRNLQALSVPPKTRILVKEPMSRDVKTTDMFSFNDGFKSSFYKIKVGVITSGNKVESQKERQDTEKKNDASRQFVVEAAIVRIMKQRKELAHQLLVTEVLGQLTAQFKPDVPMIKKRIESLIEREYLERVENAATYRYLA